MGRGWIDLHGHSHGKLKPQTRQYDLGVDAWDYRPVTLETILGSRHTKPGPRTLSSSPCSKLSSRMPAPAH